MMALLLPGLSPRPAQAHPHIFVETALRIVTDASGRATAIEVSWTYDDLYSLLVLEDMDLDSDYDGLLTEGEVSRLQGFDMQWVSGYAGDLYAQGPEGDIALGAPQPVETVLAQGRITSRHVRALAAPQTDLVLKAYDPTFYTAYDLTGGVQVPAGCVSTLRAADTDAAYARVETLMKEGNYADDDYPEVGEAFADTVQVTCNGG